MTRKLLQDPENDVYESMTVSFWFQMVAIAKLSFSKGQNRGVAAGKSGNVHRV